MESRFGQSSNRTVANIEAPHFCHQQEKAGHRAELARNTRRLCTRAPTGSQRAAVASPDGETRPKTARMRNVRKLLKASQTYDIGWKATTMAFFLVTSMTHAHLSLNAFFPAAGRSCLSRISFGSTSVLFPTLAVGGITRSVGGQAEEEEEGGRWRHCHVITVGFPTWRLG